MASRHRILFFHLAQGDRLTGGPRMVHQLASRIDRKRFEACFVTARPTDLSRALEADGVEVRTVPLPAALDVYGKKLEKPGPGRALSAAGGILAYNRDVSRVMADFRPDLVWVSNLRTFLSILPAAWRRRVPIVWNIWLGQPSRGAVRWMNELALRQARTIVTEYRAQAAEIFTADQMETARPKIRTVYTGHPVPELGRDGGRRKTAPSPLVVGTMGAFSPRKNQGLFLEAARLVHEHAPSVKFLIAGEAATPAEEVYGEEIRTQCREAGLDAVVEWCGWVDEPHDFLDRLDVYVQSSEHEGLPGAVREAMLNGLPVVGTGVGGTPEIIVDGETGYLVERGDAEAIATAIRKLNAEPELSIDMGRRGRKRAEELFSRDAFLTSFEEVLGEIFAES